MVLGGIGTTVTLLGIGAIVVLGLRDTSNRVECSNHLRQIGVALNKYADARETFPAATRDPRQMAPNHRLSWMADAVPLLAEGTPRNKVYQDVAKQIDRTHGWDDQANASVVTTTVRPFLCPGHPRFEPNRSLGLTHYVGVAGVGPGAADLRREDKRAGMFGHDRGVKRSEVREGISYTMMVLETSFENGPWLAGGFPTVRGLAPDEERYSGPGRPFGGMHHKLINVLYVDGSVRQMPDETPANVFRALATLRRQED
jgi:prepilin-type processing-associated H-X9-DG protein